MDAVLHRPGEGEAVIDRPGRRVVIHVDRPELTVTESHYADGQRGPGPHVHHRHVDAFWVLAGELTFGVGPDVAGVPAPAGTFVAVPAGVVHTFANTSGAEARFLNVHAPSMGFGDHLRSGGDEGDFDSAEPPDDGGRPATDAVVLGSGQGDVLRMGPAQVIFKAERDELSLTRTTLPPGYPGPVLHRHEGFVDSFFVLDGTLTLRIGERSVEAGPGTWASLPPGTPHTFSNHSDAPVEALNLMAPGGFQRYLREVAAELGDGPPDPQAMARIAARHDFRPVG